MSSCYAAIELGGTNVAVLAGRGPGRCSAIARLATKGPAETLAAIVAALKALRADGWAFSSVGLACFGPLELDRRRPDFGHVLPTPKPGWSGADVVGALTAELDVPVVLETDVNAAAVGEGRWGACQGLPTHAYVTAGTGVGVGVCVDGTPIHGLLHPEAGHLRPHRDRALDPFPGVCSWHGDCVEGLASGRAIRARMGGDAVAVAADDPVWDLAGAYLGQLCAALALTVSPHRIVLGGGIGRQPRVLQAARRSLAADLGGYLVRPQTDALDDYLVPPVLGPDSGLLGALALAGLFDEQAML